MAVPHPAPGSLAPGSLAPGSLAPGSLADGLVELARRRGVAAAEEAPVAALLDAAAPDPLIPHRLLLVAGAVLAVVFRHDRSLAEPAPGDAGTPPSADCSF